MGKYKYSQYLLYLLYGLFVISMIIFNFFLPLDIGKGKVKKDDFKGTIMLMFRNKENRNALTFRVKVNYYFTNVDAEVWAGSWEYAQVGDSIIKKPDTLMIVIKKPDGSSREFYYK